MANYQIIIGFLLLIFVAAEFKIVTEEFFDQAFSSDEVVDWKLKSNLYGQITSICGNYSLFGGYNIFGYQAEASKKYDSGVDHQQLFISFDLFTIDSWESEIFSVYIDGVSVYSFTANYIINQPTSRSISCGWDAISDRINTVSFSIPHYRRDFILKLSSNLNQLAYDESWGIRNLKIVAQYDSYSISIVTEEFMANNFTESSKDWTLTGVTQGQEFSICNSSKLFGGYNIFGKGSNVSKTFTNLIDHQGIIVNMDIWMIDTVESNDYVIIELDGQIYNIQRPDQLYSDESSKLCGSPYFSERIVPVSIFIPHQGPEATIQIKSSYDELKDNESFGIQNLRILTQSCLNTGCNTISREYNQEYYIGNGWKSKSGADISSRVQSCNQTSFFGGHNDTIVKKYQNITQHSGIRLFFRLLTTGNWLANTKIKVIINDVGSVPIAAQFFTAQKVCQKPEETVRNYYLDVPHQNDFLELKILFEGLYIDSAFSIKDLTLIAYDDDHSLQVVSKEFTEKSFSNPTGWLVSGNQQGALVSICGQLQVFGGFDIFGLKTNATKVYSALPPHEFLYVTFEVFFIDTWDREDFTVMLDNEIVSVSTKQGPWTGNEQLCGLADSKEEAIFIRIVYPHISSSVKITFVDSLNELPNSESWGIRNLIISTGNFNNNNPLSPKCQDQIQKLCPPSTPILCPPITVEACPVQESVVCPAQEPVACPGIEPIVCPIDKPVLSTILSSKKVLTS